MGCERKAAGKKREFHRLTDNFTLSDQLCDSHATSGQSIMVEFVVFHHEIWTGLLPTSVLIYDLCIEHE
jgi:hypothetical protein